MKKNNKYKIHLQELGLKDGSQEQRSIKFEFENHDNILSLIEKTKDSGRFENKSDNIEFIVGLKLFSEVMLRNKDNPLFKEFLPAFKDFMKELKSTR
ncbi:MULTISPECIES: DUF3861 domain-containing protein [unclassified Sphingobacterium]|uniref:DUF3861 domain-containing protein n=1 Tax=unclassified Sphingobacterium TaxID=2609468 RepID=UPI0025FE9C7C|nr:MULTISPECIES: DUF3861 domain-containing protein [unclassified Sphingobacterium]